MCKSIVIVLLLIVQQSNSFILRRNLTQNQVTDQSNQQRNSIGCLTGFQFNDLFQNQKTINEIRDSTYSIAQDKRDNLTYLIRQGKIDKYDYTESKLKNELLILNQMNNLSDINVLRYVECYYFSDQKSSQNFLIQYLELTDILDIKYNKSNQILNNPQMFNYFKYSKQKRFQNFIDLFQTLSILHENQITLRNISPENIYINKDLQALTDNNLPDDIKLFFTNYFYAYYKPKPSGQTFYPDYSFIHPQTTITEDGDYDQKNDIFSLSMTYFQIEMYSFSQQQDNNKWFVPFIFQNVSLSNTNSFGDDLNGEERRQKIKLAIDTFRTQIEKYVFSQDQLRNSLFTQIENIVQSNKTNEQKSEQLIQVCENNCDCVMYAGIQYQRSFTPTAEQMLAFLTKCLNLNMLNL